MNGWIVLGVTALLIVLSAFFVIIEFALLGARRYRLEEEAPRSAAARAALRGVNELTMMLAGAQLGITICTFALGAVTKPAIDYALSPVFESWGLPYVAADVLAFALALIFVTFLHLVVGEMAPKSWAIAHPEVAAKAVSIPARAYTWTVRPLLVFVNKIANRLVAASGIEPVDRAAVGGRDVHTIRQLVEHSATVGSLDEEIHAPIAHAIELETRTAGDVVERGRVLTGVPEDARVADVHAAALESGHLRILVWRADASAPGVVHVRDTLTADPDEPAAPFARDAFVLAPETSVRLALMRMRRGSVQLAVIADRTGPIGVLTLTDLLGSVLPGVSEDAAS